eukprot:181639_1
MLNRNITQKPYLTRRNWFFYKIQRSTDSALYKAVFGIKDEHKVDIIWDIIYPQQVHSDYEEKEEQKDDTIDDDVLYSTPNGMDMNTTKDTLDALQIDLEHYMLDQQEMEFGRRSGKKMKKKNYMMEKLTHFHPSKAQVIRDWVLLKNQYHENMVDVLLVDNDLFDSFSILFDLIAGCYNVMQREYKLMAYSSDSTAINLVFLNMNRLYGAARMKKKEK